MPLHASKAGSQFAARQSAHAWLSGLAAQSLKHFCVAHLTVSAKHTEQSWLSIVSVSMHISVFASFPMFFNAQFWTFCLTIEFGSARIMPSGLLTQAPDAMLPPAPPPPPAPELLLLLLPLAPPPLELLLELSPPLELLLLVVVSFFVSPVVLSSPQAMNAKHEATKKDRIIELRFTCFLAGKEKAAPYHSWVGVAR